MSLFQKPREPGEEDLTTDGHRWTRNREMKGTERWPNHHGRIIENRGGSAISSRRWVAAAMCVVAMVFPVRAADRVATKAAGGGTPMIQFETNFYDFGTITAEE